jgi:hypothetical protein
MAEYGRPTRAHSLALFRLCWRSEANARFTILGHRANNRICRVGRGAPADEWKSAHRGYARDLLVRDVDVPATRSAGEGDSSPPDQT